jgi:hypothetical protein
LRRLPGQAARLLARVAHILGTLALALAVLAGVGLAGLAWRLSQGPLELAWLAQRMETALNAEGDARVSIGSAAIAWEGFREGVDRPFDIRLTDVVVVDPVRGQRLDLPRLDVSLSLRGLVRGQVQPRAMVIDGARLVVVRMADGGIGFQNSDAPDAVEAPDGTGVVVALIAELARPPAADSGEDVRSTRFSQLRRIRIRDAGLTVIDRPLAATWRAKLLDLDLVRAPEGGVQGRGQLALTLGGEEVALAASGTLEAGGAEMHVHASLGPVAPAALAREAALFAPLAALDAKVSGDADLDFGPQLAVRRVRVDAHVGPGTARIGASDVPFLGGDLAAEGAAGDFLLRGASLRLPGHDVDVSSLLRATGAIHHEGGRLRAALVLDLDRMDFADLGRVWPVGIGVPARTWVTGNITAGVARDGHADVVLEANEDLSDVTLASASGTMQGDGLTVHWLRPVPPIEHGMARLDILDPDTLAVTVTAGRQAREGAHDEGIGIRSGRMRITGLMHKDQVATIDADLAGPLADVITLLRHKRLHLLDRFPIALNEPAGQVGGTLSVTLPLDNNLSIEQVDIHTQMHLDGARLTGLVAGRDLDKGNLDIAATSDGLTLKGQAEIAAIPTTLDAQLDFRAGGPAQVVRRIVASGRADAGRLAAAGLDAGDVLSGPVALQATLTERRNGQGEIQASADLTGAGLYASPIEWRKPAGQKASASARLRLQNGRMVGIDNIVVDGEGLTLRADTEIAGGKIAAVLIQRARLGETEAHGTVRFPPGKGPIRASVEGSIIDLSALLSRHDRTAQPREPDDAPAGPAWNADLRFDRAIMAGGASMNTLLAHLENDGKLTRRLHVEGLTGPDAHFRLDIVPDAAGVRKMSASAENAGDLLRALDLAHTMQGGTLTVSAAYADAEPHRPLSGTAEIDEFRVRGAPALGMLLQAMTLYGLVEVLQGPGLGFRHMVAPFSLAGDVLELRDARAFSPSLGLTVKGRIDIAQERMDLAGTIVPAYFFNSLLGNLPLVGKLFSPEEGGGLFAASYAMRGPLDDPAVTVNPLSALTPGFLRGVFGIF